MKITTNDTAYEVPFDTALISLADFVAYHREYGRDLDKKLKEIAEKKYTGDEAELQKAIDLEAHLDMEALYWISFWTKIDIVEIKDLPSISPLLHEYRILRYFLKDDVDLPQQFPTDISWKNKTWVIQDFKVSPASDMLFNEIITSKEIMRQVYAIGNSKWEALPYLCAVYFRKKGEPFTDALVAEGGERMELLKQLPLKHALPVAFFLNIYVNTWSKTLAYSAKKEREIVSLN